MGWFDEQIRERKQYDDEAFSEAFANMASAVMGKRISAAVSDDRRAAKDAIDDILKHYHIKSREIPDSISGCETSSWISPAALRHHAAHGAPGGRVDIVNAIGAMLGFFRESGKAVALIPGGLSGYTYFDPETGRRKRIDRKNQHLFGEEAIVFYKPFPLKKLSLSALAGYIVEDALRVGLRDDRAGYAGAVTAGDALPDDQPAAFRPGAALRQRPAAGSYGRVFGVRFGERAAGHSGEGYDPGADRNKAEHIR